MLSGNVIFNVRESVIAVIHNNGRTAVKSRFNLLHITSFLRIDNLME